MKKMVLVFALAAIALGGSAVAQDPAYQNNIGIYFDEAGTVNCGSAALLETSNVYVVLTRLTAPSVLAWEGKITYTENLVETGFTHRGQAIDAASKPGEHVVGYANALPAVGGACVVADVALLSVDLEPAYAWIDEIYFSLQENGLPAYLDADSNPYTLHPVNGDKSVPIFYLNTDCEPVGVEESSFGSVKSLFR